jgi:hypothetical protein
LGNGVWPGQSLRWSGGTFGDGGGLHQAGYAELAQEAGHMGADGLGLMNSSAPIWALARPAD